MKLSKPFLTILGCLFFQNLRGDEIVLPEDKNYYAEAEEHYGPGVETMVEDEDTQGIDEAIISSEKPKDFDIVEKRIPKTTFNNEFLREMMKNPALIRNVSFLLNK